jgi:ppGpp synthetase/RelA/SpoT-type nucleotidyltranferase
MARQPAAPRSGASAKRPAKKPARGEDKTAAAVQWYQRQRPLYEQLAQKVEAVVREVLDDQKVQYHSITSRPKEVDSFAAKAAKEEYTDPKKQIKDMAGVRTIAYVDSQARQIAEVVEGLFDIDPEHSGDTSVRLGVDRVGYRATAYYVARFSGDRCRLPEYHRFEGLEFEIQVRTILQHAWAEIEHDRNYKFTGVLPNDIQRRFAVLSGVLELADREFDAIASSIDAYAADVAEKAEKGELDIPINTTSLRQYMLTKFEGAVEAGLRPSLGRDDSEHEIVQELTAFGISTLEQLDNIVPADLPKQKDLIKNASFLGLARDVMMIHDADRYFSEAWEKHWTGLRTGPILEAYGLDVAALAERYGLNVVEES